MKNIIYAICLLCTALMAITPVSAYSQKGKEIIIQAPKMPVDKDTKMVNYTHVVEATGTAAELYARGLGWMNKYYKNPTDVIREKNELEKKLVGKARFGLKGRDEKNNMEINDGRIVYDIVLNFKDGKFKYEITKINYQQSSYLGIEKWIEENNKTYNARYASFLVQVDGYMQELIKEMKKAITTAEKKKSDNW